MLVTSFVEQLKWYNSEDRSYAQKAANKMKGKTKKERDFVATLPSISKTEADSINEILKSFVDNPLGENLFGRKYCEDIVTNTLLDNEFWAFLIQSKLFSKVIFLKATDDASTKLRVYAAILGFVDCKNEFFAN